MPRLAPCLLLALAAACHPAQTRHNFQFFAPLKQEDPVPALTRALAAEGLAVAKSDTEAGILQTRWEDTGFGYGFVNGAGATIWRRYSIVIARREGAADITVRADTQRCAAGAISSDGIEIVGVCTTQFAEGLVSNHQQQLDDLGARLRLALGGT